MTIMHRLRRPRTEAEVEPSVTLSEATSMGRLVQLRAVSDARAEVMTACRNLGLLFGKHPDDVGRPLGDLVRAAYRGGWNACETRLAAPDMADAIATALQTPAAVLEQLPGESLHRWQVRAVQQVVAYGMAKR